MQQLLVIFCLFLGACGGEHLDNGRLVRMGHTLYSPIPMGISAAPDITPIVESAVDWWNDQIGTEVFFMPSPTPDITVEFGPIIDPTNPDDIYGEIGIAYLTFSYFDGLILDCDVVVSWDYRDDTDTATEITKHELGHCLGLADDTPSVDLNSVMQSALWTHGEVTAGDRDLILGWRDCAE